MDPWIFCALSAVLSGLWLEGHADELYHSRQVFTTQLQTLPHPRHAHIFSSCCIIKNASTVLYIVRLYGTVDLDYFLKKLPVTACPDAYLNPILWTNALHSTEYMSHVEQLWDHLQSKTVTSAWSLLRSWQWQHSDSKCCQTYSIQGHIFSCSRTQQTHLPVQDSMQVIYISLTFYMSTVRYLTNGVITYSAFLFCRLLLK
jgi:hypothetical protein